MRATRGTITTLHFLRRPPTHSHCIGTASGVGKRGTFVIPPLLRPLSTFVLLLALLSVVQTSQPALLYPDVTLSNHNGLEYLFSLFCAVQKLVLFFFSTVWQALFGVPGLRFQSSAAHTFRPGPCTSKLHVSTPSPSPRPYPLLHTRPPVRILDCILKSRLVASEASVRLSMLVQILHVLSTLQYPSPVFVGITHTTFAQETVVIGIQPSHLTN
jgi:hypothetical protein